MLLQVKYEPVMKTPTKWPVHTRISLSDHSLTMHFNVFPLWNIFLLFCRLLIFFQNFFFYEKFFQESHLSVKQIPSRSGLTFCRTWSGSNVFAKSWADYTSRQWVEKPWVLSCWLSASNSNEIISKWLISRQIWEIQCSLMQKVNVLKCIPKRPV